MSTPLADNHSLYHSEYLLGPVETIVCSHQALVSGLLSVHDITEAYRTLSMRIRRLSCHLSAVSDAFPALNPLRDKGAEVVAALRRDVSWALRSPAHTSGDLSLRSSGFAAETVGLESTIYVANRATDSSTLCHYALRLLSEIFRLPALSSVFACTPHFLWSWDHTHDAPSTRPWPSPRGYYFHRSLPPVTSSILGCFKDCDTLIVGPPDAKAPERCPTSSDGRPYPIP